MNEVRWTPELELPDRPRVVALGAFDGVHLGHAGMIGRMRHLAREAGAEATVLTFEPGPREFAGGVRRPGRRLTTSDEQLCRLREMGVDLTVIIEFPGLIRDIEPEDFVHDVLVRQLNAACVCASASHRFGRAGRGDLALLRALGEEHAFQVEPIAPVALGDQRISSTIIRGLLADGAVMRAGTLLGRPYSIMADVMPGQGLGAEMGFPTANLRVPPEKLVPKDGVYAGVAGPAGGECALIDDPLAAAINIGAAPTVGRGERVIEAHLVGEQCDLRGAQIKVEFLRWLRDEETFADREALIDQIGRDAAQCATIAGEGFGL